VDWALIVLIGIATPTVIPVESAEHCASAIIHLETTMRGKQSQHVQTMMSTACIPLKGQVPDPDSPNEIRDKIIRHELRAICASEAGKADGC
jgi:hypothetical protein